MKFNNKFLYGVLFIVVVLLLFGCSSESNSDSGSDGGESADELRVALNAQPPTLDPLISTATVTRDIALQIFEPLVTINANLQPEPMLAESYETSDDGKLITFHLREGIKFHNGKEMTAEDVVASMQRWQEYSSRAKAAFSEGVFKAKDKYTVLLELQKPNRTAFSVLSSTTQLPAIMPKEVIESAGEDGIDEYIGTGPFKFDEWKQDQHIKLTKFKEYQASSAPSDGPAGKREALIEELYFMIVTDSSTRLAGMKSGEYDLATTIPFDSYDQIESDSNIKPYTGPSGFNLIVFNKKEGAFSDVKVRQAVAAALDLEEILIASLSSEKFYRMNPGLMMKEQSDWYTQAGSEYYNQKDPEKAKRLLQEAGYDGEPVTFITSREYEDFYTASVVVKEQLEEIGMNINLEVYDWATVIESQGDSTAYDAFITGFGINTDPTQLIFLDSKNGWAGWTDSPKIDRLLDEIRGASSKEEAKAKNEELQLAAWEYLPVLKIGDKNFLYAVSKDVKGFKDIIGMNFWNVEKTN
ncbi:ABC transporter substrate-binding protein [Virgibacillus sp. JSM 102003]|uniref:ABC transporter substrate-binding protein n=1 Tax=Virgibacillus sp. JSM 102003 TaxID=1562108 RepID=UPI0035BF1152